MKQNLFLGWQLLTFYSTPVWETMQYLFYTTLLLEDMSMKYRVSTLYLPEHLKKLVNYKEKWETQQNYAKAGSVKNKRCQCTGYHLTFLFKMSKNTFRVFFRKTQVNSSRKLRDKGPKCSSLPLKMFCTKLYLTFTPTEPFGIFCSS